MPAMNEAISAIKGISKQDIAEIRIMRKPSKIIKLIMQALCILLNVEPIMTQSRQDGLTHYEPSYWLAAQTPAVLNHPNLSQFLIDYDRNKVSKD
jgi:dynein heavy chain, axonemal